MMFSVILSLMLAAIGLLLSLEGGPYLPSEEDVPELGFDPAALPVHLHRPADS